MKPMTISLAILVAHIMEGDAKDMTMSMVESDLLYSLQPYTTRIKRKNALSLKLLNYTLGY